MRPGSHGAPIRDARDARAAQSDFMSAAIQSLQVGACPQCALDYVRDQASVAWWLAQRGPSAHDALGAVCCPAHTWRLTLDARGTTTVENLVTLYAHALDHVLHDARLALARLERTGAARWLQLPGALAPGWFAARSACPLCVRRAAEAAADTRDRITVALNVWIADQSPGARAVIGAQTCGAHRVDEAEEGHAPQIGAADAAQARWWLAPGTRAQDVAFIRRLLRAHDEPRFPDDLCPLCVARLRHERVLIAALAAGEPFETVSLAAAKPAEPLAEVSPERSALRIDLATLCARHTALLRAPAHDTAGADDSTPDDLPEETAEELIAQALTGDAPGALRAETSERDCPACAILHAWESARIEGLHRAAGGTPLSEAVTARLVWELDHACYLFCAPHLRRLLRFGPAETTWATLGPALIRTLEDLRDRLRAGEGETALPALRLAAATLGGAPA